MTFLNLTNHPHATWPDPQRAAALALAEEVAIEDFPFPNVDPGATTTQVDALADEVAGDIAGHYAPSSTVVHLSGEYTLTVALVARLQGLGYRVFSSTTERMVSFDADGNRVLKFQFARFRDYAPLYVVAEQGAH